MGCCCIFLAAFVVLMSFPAAEAVQLYIHWDDHGECPSSFQWLILFKMSLTLFLYSLCAVHFRCDVFSKPQIAVLSMVLLFVWCIMASIEVLDVDGNTGCNDHDEHTAGYYDFMFIELMTVYVLLALFVCFASWFVIATERGMKIVSAGAIGAFTISMVFGMPLLEIVVLVAFWNDHGLCPDDFQWYIL